MATITNPKAVALGGVAAAAAVAALLAVRGPDGKSVEIPFDHQPDPAKAKCVKVNVYADAECMEALGLAADSATDAQGRTSKQGSYLRIEACGDGEELPSCVIPVEPTAEETPFDASKKMLRAKKPDADDESPCACSTGSNCEQQITDLQGVSSWVAAPKGLTISNGKWRGTGCLRKTCVELAGRKSMPAACDVPEVIPPAPVVTPTPQPDRYTVKDEKGVDHTYVLSPCPPDGVGACYVENGPGFPAQEAP